MSRDKEIIAKLYKTLVFLHLQCACVQASIIHFLRFGAFIKIKRRETKIVNGCNKLGYEKGLYRGLTALEMRREREIDINIDMNIQNNACWKSRCAVGSVLYISTL